MGKVGTGWDEKGRVLTVLKTASGAILTRVRIPGPPQLNPLRPAETPVAPLPVRSHCVSLKLGVARQLGAYRGEDRFPQVAF